MLARDSTGQALVGGKGGKGRDCLAVREYLIVNNAHDIYIYIGS